MDRVDIEGTAQERRLYELIWKRTIASQMAESRVMNTSLKISSDKRPERYGLQSVQLLFDGFMKVYLESRDDEEPEGEEILLPDLPQGTLMLENGVSAQCKYTAPPARYSEATLVKKLEELGIGRPSTYAATVDTLTRGRGYAVKGDKEGKSFKVNNLSLKNGIIKTSQKTEVTGAEKGKLLPQEIGLIVTDFLVANFTDILDYDFTANVEADFDQVAEGKKVWNETIASFYKPFHSHVEQVLADRNYSKVSREIGIAPDGQKGDCRLRKIRPLCAEGRGRKPPERIAGKRSAHRNPHPGRGPETAGTSPHCGTGGRGGRRGHCADVRPLPQVRG